MLPPFLPGLNAVGRTPIALVSAPEAERGQFWREPQETTYSFKMIPQTNFTSLGLSTNFTIFHPKSPIIGEGVG